MYLSEFLIKRSNPYRVQFDMILLRLLALSSPNMERLKAVSVGISMSLPSRQSSQSKMSMRYWGDLVDITSCFSTKEHSCVSFNLSTTKKSFFLSFCKFGIPGQYSSLDSFYVSFNILTNTSLASLEILLCRNTASTRRPSFFSV